MNEVMGLASMNPVVGTNTNSGGTYIINNLSQDKDLQNSNLSVSKTLNKKSSIITLDKKGKLVTKPIETLQNSLVEIFFVKNDSNYGKLLEELSVDYNFRKTHNSDYIYELFTGNKLLTEDQIRYDPLLEQIDLPKLSKIISGEADNIKDQFNKMKTKKISKYVPGVLSGALRKDEANVQDE